MTGYWFVNEPAPYAPLPMLADFLAEGPAPVCVGFGSMALADPQGDVRAIIGALSKSGRRGIILSGWGGLRTSVPDNNVLFLDEVPHSWLLPRVAMVIHHGGAGTTAVAFRAGIPQIVAPVFGDQLFWASRVWQLGVGPQPIPHKMLNSESLAAAISAADEVRVRRRATELGNGIRAEDGSRQAVAVIEELISSRTDSVSASDSLQMQQVH